MPKKSKKEIELGEQIYQLSSLVAGEFSLQEVLDKLAEAAVNIVGVKACSIRLLDEDTNDLKMRSTYGLSEVYRNKGVVSKTDPVIEAAFKGKAVVVDNMAEDPRIRYPEATLREGLVSQLTVAMTFRNESIGVLRLYSPQPKHFDRDDINLARAVASQCAVAITNARFYSQALAGARSTEQMRLAGLIQRRMIPEKVPSLCGFDIAATYIPCFDVGGDFYDFLPLGENKLGIVIADVMGKGMPAALMMSWFRGVIRAYTDSFGRDAQSEAADWDHPADAETDSAVNEAYVKRAIAKFNRMACQECHVGEFITLFYAILDCTTKTMTYASCGHEPTLLLRDGEFKDLATGGLVLGVIPEARYDIETIALHDGDCLVFYTDGLIDAVNFDDDMWTRGQMILSAQKAVRCSADHVAKNILRYRRRFVGLARQIDDTSIVVAKVGEPEKDATCKECRDLGKEPL
ncbi:MAG: SpoIIE family protein phosphatase [Phycisphaerae bacterium]|nr:SpoIIE family protein phosphatase [Phycisphaerae bacterium]